MMVPSGHDDATAIKGKKSYDDGINALFGVAVVATASAGAVAAFDVRTMRLVEKKRSKDNRGHISIN
jgi:hypothetical protein